MEPDTMNDQQLREKLLLSEPIEPRGWFRWLHNHYLGRFGRCHPDLIYGEPYQDVWGKVSDKPEPLYKRFGTQEEWIDILNRNAWAAGMGGKLIYTVGKHWRMLNSDARGAFFAGLSELHVSDTTMKKTLELLPAMSLAPESLCQLACNAIRHNKYDLLESLLLKYPAPTDKVKRFGAHYSSDRWEEREITKLSNRVIDMILEAALFWNNIDAAKLAIQHGADPDIPIWQLERSYNIKFSALGYAIDSEYSHNMESHHEMTSLLLDSGASATGIEYSGYNNELSIALAKGQRDLVDQLISLGASLSKPEKTGKVEVVSTEGSETKVIGPGGSHFFGHFGSELKWAYENIGSIIPLVPVSEKQVFFSPDAQGGKYFTMMNKVIGNLDMLKHYESLGLDTRLSAEELCTAVDAGAFNSLVYLLGKFGNEVRDKAFFRIRRKKPDIGASWGFMHVVPQDDGVNIARGFEPQGLEPLLLPDGTRLHVDLSAIAPVGHALGPCYPGHFWLRKDMPVLRRRKDRVIMRRLEQRWVMEPLPLRKPGTCKHGQRYLDECLPLVREFNGTFIYLGVNFGRIWWHLGEGEMKKCIHDWQDFKLNIAVQDTAEQLIKAQVDSNTLPSAPLLSDVELRGYPAEFWPYLIRLENGFIGMTVESCAEKPDIFKEYCAWARKEKKHERDFKPDPRLLEWEHWSEVPPDYKPYFYFDTMLRKRPAIVSADYYNIYKYAMKEKVGDWLRDMGRKWHL